LFIDIHAHILPGLDDGARTIEESIAMAQTAMRNGTEILVATPHIRTGSCEICKEDILSAVANINRELSQVGSELLVLPGAEYSLEPNLSKRLADGELLTINNMGRHIIIELPSMLIPENTEHILYEIQLQGVTPIIAHPERNHVLSKNPELLQAYSKRGVLSQVTSASVTGWFGREVRNTSLRFIRLGMVQFLASDAHTVTGRNPVLKPAYELVWRKWGQAYAQTLVYDNPYRIINGDNVEVGLLPRKQSIWNRINRIFDWG